MKTIVIGCTKGGVSKTTTAVNLQVALTLRDKKVYLIDADKEDSACKWAALRESRNVKPGLTVGARRGNLSGAIRTLKEGGLYDYCLIDVTGTSTKELFTAMSDADILIAPLQCSQHDINSLLELEQEITAARDAFDNHDLKPLLYQTRCVTHAGQRKERENFVAAAAEFPIFTLLESFMTERKSYRMTAETGLGILEMDDAVATRETNALVEEIIRHGA